MQIAFGIHMTDKQMQCLLTYLGYDPGEIDGIAGKRTQAALEAFRRDYGCGPEGLAGAVGGTVPKLDTAGTVWERAPHFRREEFRCTCGGKYCNGFPVEPDEKLVLTLENLRTHFGVPFSPNSAIRCPKRNAEVGGVGDSQHLLGMAADISIPGISPETAAACADTLLPGTGGIGIYSWGIHVDTRAVKSRWRG